MRALVFDIDNTLTPPRRALQAEMAEALCGCRIPFHLAAGSDLELVCPQLIEPLYERGFRGGFDAFVSNGSHHVRCRLGATIDLQTVFELRLREHLGPVSFGALCSVLVSTLDSPEFSLAGTKLCVDGPRLNDRGGMINLAPIGRPAQMTSAAYERRDAFVAFDLATEYRARLLAHLQQILAPWRENHGLRVTLGGQTSFDLIIDGYDKRYSLRALLAAGYERLTYIGDAFYPGGNDAAVLELVGEWSPGSCPIEVVQVSGWEDTLAWLRAQGR